MVYKRLRTQQTLPNYILNLLICTYNSACRQRNQIEPAMAASRRQRTRSNWQQMVTACSQQPLQTWWHLWWPWYINKNMLYAMIHLHSIYANNTRLCNIDLVGSLMNNCIIVDESCSCLIESDWSSQKSNDSSSSWTDSYR